MEKDTIAPGKQKRNKNYCFRLLAICACGRIVPGYKLQQVQADNMRKWFKDGALRQFNREEGGGKRPHSRDKALGRCAGGRLWRKTAGEQSCVWEKRSGDRCSCRSRVCNKERRSNKYQFPG